MWSLDLKDVVLFLGHDGIMNIVAWGVVRGLLELPGRDSAPARSLGRTESQTRQLPRSAKASAQVEPPWLLLFDRHPTAHLNAPSELGGSFEPLSLFCDTESLTEDMSGIGCHNMLKVRLLVFRRCKYLPAETTFDNLSRQSSLEHRDEACDAHQFRYAQLLRCQTRLTSTIFSCNQAAMATVSVRIALLNMAVAKPGDTRQRCAAR